MARAEERRGKRRAEAPPAAMVRNWNSGTSRSACTALRLSFAIPRAASAQQQARCWQWRPSSPACCQEGSSVPLPSASTNVLASVPSAEAGNKHSWKGPAVFWSGFHLKCFPGLAPKAAEHHQSQREGERRSARAPEQHRELLPPVGRELQPGSKRWKRPFGAGKWKPALPPGVQHVPKRVHTLPNSFGPKFPWWWMRIMPLLGAVIHPTLDFKRPFKT